MIKYKCELCEEFTALTIPELIDDKKWSIYISKGVIKYFCPKHSLGEYVLVKVLKKLEVL